MAAFDFSIVSGWFPFLLFWLTVSACVIAVVLRRDLLMESLIGIPLGLLLALALFLYLRYGQTIPAGAPQSLYLWLAGACLLAGLVIAGWHHASWPRRSFGVVAVGLAVVSAGSSVNQAFQYYPTLDRLLGKNANHFLDDSSLKALRAQVAKTGQLPDHGATLSVAIPFSGLKFTPRDAYVWVPPAWFAPNHPQLPVIELLHGTPGSPSDWTRADYADATSLAFAEQHGGQAPILVMPDLNGSWTADSECVDSTLFGDVETYLTRVVPGFMQKNFNARTTGGSMAIAGLSEGGTCAITLALNHPNLYSTFAFYSGFKDPTYQTDNAQQTIDALFGGSRANYNAHDPQYLLTHGNYPGLAGWFETGAEDPLSLPDTRTLAQLAPKAGIDTCFSAPPGEHYFAFWKRTFADSLPWLSWRLKLTPRPQSVPAQCTPGAS